MGPEVSDKTDEQIAFSVQEGDIEAYGELVTRYESKMMRYANKFLYHYEDRQDAVQDVFLRAYENIQGFDTDRRFSPWIYRIAHNVFINVIKKHGRENLSFFDTDSLLSSSIVDEDDSKRRENHELRELLDKSLEKLDAKYREVLVLHYFEDKSYEDIAEILHIPVGTVGIRLKRGRDKLKESYDRQG